MQNTIFRHFLISTAAALFFALFSVGCSDNSGTKDGDSRNDDSGNGVIPSPIPGPTPGSGLGTPVLETPRRGSGLDYSYYTSWLYVAGSRDRYHFYESCSEREYDSINWSAPEHLLSHRPIYNLGIRSHTFCYFRIRAVLYHHIGNRYTYGLWSNIITLNNLFFIEESPRSDVSLGVRQIGMPSGISLNNTYTSDSSYARKGMTVQEQPTVYRESWITQFSGETFLEPKATDWRKAVTATLGIQKA